MLKRDKYTDKCINYLPTATYQGFWNSADTGLRKYLLFQSDIKKLKHMETIQKIKIGSVLTLGLLTTIFYSRIPILRQNTKFIFRIPITLAVVFFPYQYIKREYVKSLKIQMQEVYNKRKQAYERFLQTDDIFYLNNQKQIIQVK